MKKLFISTTIILAVLTAFFAFDGQSYIHVRFFTRSGEMSRDGIKVWRDTITCTSATMTIDISNAGYQAPPAVTVTAQRNTSNAYESPQVSIKSISATSIVVNVTQGSASLVTILGLSVLQGPSTVFVPDPQNVVLHVAAIGK